ncbi:hypothetical protein I7I51_07247 [Histoplasma capsulatum]|uniref:Uncharacterized protein n=1 Tax=Ajellomyces capsulatus TaxID=5037 RepID=A0A8A1MMI3_AJECA|nr:hypothetical protein I7I51_07247 [Histoplasma capsulatum]
MADIRALLRNELASRRATDSNNSSKARPVKKRKLEPEFRGDGHKKPKTTQEQITQEKVCQQVQSVEDEEHDDPSIIDEAAQLEQEQTSELSPQPTTALPSEPAESQPRSQPRTIDEDEWAAFEREVAAPTKIIPAAPSHATISAGPLSAAELAQREKLDKQVQMRVHEQEASLEKEDAARLLEEEFEEMDELEERVRRLKEMRDEIRRRGVTREGAGVGVGVLEGEDQSEEMTGQEVREGGGAGEDEDEVDEDEDEDWDSWRYR